MEISKGQREGRVWEEDCRSCHVLIVYSKNNEKSLESFKHLSIPSPKELSPETIPRLACESKSLLQLYDL